MKLVTTTADPARHGGIARVLATIKDAGFDGADLSFTNREGEWYTDTAAYLRAVKASGLPILQSHAPFPGKRYGDPEFSENSDRLVRHAIRVAGEAGAGIIVVHPIHCPPLTTAEQMAWNLDYYRSLEPLARSCGVRIALENMWSVVRADHFVPNVCSLPDEFARYADALDPEVFTCCLDLGHFAMLGCPPDKAIREMGHRVGALHVHDNDCIHDLHTLPFLGEINWQNVAQALADIDYAGHFTFEAIALERLPDSAFATGQKLLCEVGRHLLDMIAACRANAPRKVAQS